VIVAGIGEEIIVVVVLLLLPGRMVVWEGKTIGGVRLPGETTTGGAAALDRARLRDTAVAVLLVAIIMTMTGVTVSVLQNIGGVVRIETIVLRIGIIATVIVDIVLEN
jgi:hypothetical protein